MSEAELTENERLMLEDVFEGPLSDPATAAVEQIKRGAIEAGLAEVDRFAAMLWEATEAEFTEPCRFDHHGDCQGHGYDAPCLIPRAQAALAGLRADCECLGYTIRTDYGTGIEHDVDRSSCAIHAPSPVTGHRPPQEVT